MVIKMNKDTFYCQQCSCVRMYSSLSFGRKSPFRNKTMAVVNFYEIEGNGDEVVVFREIFNLTGLENLYTRRHPETRKWWRNQ